MDSLNQIELQNIRHICSHSTNFCNKINYYKTLTNDKNATEVLDEICTQCTNIKQDLSNMI
ncbi:MAG: hypothetical protein RSA08_00300 [Clostridia bacterium]